MSGAVSFFGGPRPRLFGHRGAAAVAPENTLVSFARAISDGADYLELDVHATADGHVVVIHDPTVDRTTDGTGSVKELTIEALRRLDAGYRFAGPDGGFPARGQGLGIPTLEEVLDAFPHTPLTVEVKQSEPPVAERVAQILVAYGAAERVVVAAGNDVIMAGLRPACVAHGIATSFSAGEIAEFVGRVVERRLAAYRPPAAALQVPPEWGGIQVITAATVAAAHALGVEVHAWTINEEAEMEQLLALGTDGIMTDVPALGRSVIARHAARQE